MDDALENDKQISKHNFGSRKGYSIDEAILEKRLLCDASIFIRSNTVHVITDLEACYNKKLANIRSILIESIRVD